MKSSRKKNQRGFTIVEVVMAMGILSIAISGVFILAFQVSKVGSGTEARTLAVNYAQEALDVVKNIKENNPCAFFNPSSYPNGDYAVFQSPAGSGNWVLRRLTDPSLTIPHTSQWADIDGMGVVEKRGTGMFAIDPDTGTNTTNGRVINIRSSGFGSGTYRIITVKVAWQSKGAPRQEYTTETALWNWKY